ncbi:MAG: hypothetical protein RX318_07615 [bacterium]|nr:hypothetical protein [bacterium]
MSPLDYVKPVQVLLKNHPEFTESWLRDRIVEDTSILGLGELEVKDVERLQPKAGRLDILLQDSEAGKRYEVEIMLGTVDESHIIRCIEYWDIERKRYPQYDHCAVLVAEDITARFLNVVGLFNSAIPIIAIQLNALKVSNNITLNFTKVLDEIVLGEIDDDEGAGGGATDRAYWENRASKATVEIADDCLDILREIKEDLSLKYNKHYIGLADNARPTTFVIFRAKRHFVRVEARVSDKAIWITRLEDIGITTLPGGPQRKRIHFRLTKPEVQEYRDLLKELFEDSYQETQG